MYDLLDKIELTDGRILNGVLDYVNKKHVSFVDITTLDDPIITLMVLAWRLNGDSNERFSVYCLNRFSHSMVYYLPSPIIIHHKYIQDANCSLDVTPSNMRQRSRIRVPH